jgi:hypothetical protein
MAALVAFAAPAAADTQDSQETAGFTPKQYELSRYSALDKKSPFEYDPIEEKVVAGPDPFEGISLAGYCGSGNRLTVYLVSEKDKQRITVYGDGSPNKKRDDSGFRVIGINRAKSLKGTTIELEKDGVQKRVGFEDETLRPKGGGQQQVQMVPGPGGQPIPRPVIPRPGGVSGQPQPVYQAPQAFVPGQTTAPQIGQPQPGVVNPGVPPIPTQSNQQMVNTLTAPNMAVPQVNPGVPQPQTGGRPPGVPSRRRVVLPTQ